MNRKKRKSNFIKPFFITLLLVVSLGLLGIAAYLWIREPVQTEPAALLTKEEIPEHEIPAKTDETASSDENTETPTYTRYLDQLDDEEYMRENNIYAWDAADPEAVTITFAGDILFDDRYAVMVSMRQNGGRIQNVFSPDLIEEMQKADLMMLNNEFPYSDRGTPTPDKQFTFRANPETVSYLEELGVDIVSLANNHAYDYGEEAFLDTMTTLEEQGIVYVGGGRNLREASRPVYYIIGDMKIAIVSATQIERSDNPDTREATDSSAGVFRCWNGDALLEVVREAKENSDFVIAYIHWGTENETTTDWAQEKQAPELVEAGADLIIGAHPHCLQPVDVIDGVPVVYSLGNFWFNSKTVDTGMVSITLTQDGMRDIRFLPCLQSGCKTTLLQGEEKAQALQYMQSISGNVRFDADGYITW